eukprot:NODE_232_length_2158_cov_24.446183_g155_i0.p1 GENE.NODE_232_length_2158_cov_24.446183_g155_i0~~NODE_232_length_2158_cov_24.446183_g155_i0.p1  ORF type:complete len:660 (-),score=179.22 NODE_232_length_2158_cov_24.446183_g155_i0:178-2109(-)
MLLKRFEVCPGAYAVWWRIAADRLYEVQKWGGVDVGERVSAAHPHHHFRICTRSTPSFIVAVGETLEEILRDWTHITSTGEPSRSPINRSHPFLRSGFSPTLGLFHSQPHLSQQAADESAMIHAFARLGGLLTVLGTFTAGPLHSIWSVLVFGFAYVKGCLLPVVLLWCIWCTLRFRNTPTAAVLENQHHNLRVAANWCGRVGNALDALTALVTWRNPTGTHVCIGTLLAASLWSLHASAGLRVCLDALLSHYPLALAFACYSLLVRLLHYFLPSVVAPMGLPDPLALLFCSPPTCPLPRHQSNLDWGAALPVDPQHSASLPPTTPQPAPGKDSDHSTTSPPTGGTSHGSTARNSGSARSSHSSSSSANSSSSSSSSSSSATTSSSSSSSSNTSSSSSNSGSSNSPTTGAGDTGHSGLQELFARVDQLREAEKPRDAFQALEKAFNEDPENIEIAWRMARAWFDLSAGTQDNQERERQIRKGLVTAEAALKLAPDSGMAHRWRGTLLGRLTEFLPVKEKVGSAIVIRDSFKRAVEQCPDDAYAHHCLGQWCWGMANISWMQKKAGRAFGEIPDVTYPECLAHFQRAAELGDFPGNSLCIGRCYSAMKQPQQAKEWLRRTVDAAPKSSHDREAQNEAQVLLKKL